MGYHQACYHRTMKSDPTPAKTIRQDERCPHLTGAAMNRQQLSERCALG